MTLGSGLQLLVRILGLVSGAVVVAIQARTLTVEEFGVLSTILLINGMAIAFADLGLMNTAVRRLAQSPFEQTRIVSSLLLCRAVLGILMTVGAVIFSMSLFDTNDSRVAAVIFLAGLPLGALSALQVVPMAGLRLMPQNILLFLQSFFWAVVVVLLGVIQADIVGFAIGFLVSVVAQSIAIWCLCGRRFRFSMPEARRETPTLIKMALPLGIGALGVTAYYRLTGIILFAVAGATSAASFSAAFRVVDVLQAIPATLLVPLLPLLSKAIWANSPGRTQAIWSYASRFTVASSCMIVAGVFVLAGPIVTLLYGNEYTNAVTLLQIVIFAFIPISLGWLLTGLVVAIGAIWWYAGITLLGAILSVGASVLLVPRFGPSASAWIAVSTEVFVVAGLSVLVYGKARFAFKPSVWLKCVCAAAVMASCVSLMGESDSWMVNNLLTRVIAGAAIGILLLLATRVVSRTDFRVLLSKGSIDE